MLSKLEDGAGGQFLIKLQKKGKEIQNLYIGYVREWDKNSLLQLTPEVIKGNSLRWENMGRPSRSPKEWDQKLQKKAVAFIERFPSRSNSTPVK